MNDYNRIARWYDAIAGIVFGGSLLKAQRQYIHLIRAHQRVLIIGGGTGQILKELNALEIPVVIDFIEPSERMIEKARKRAPRLTNLKLTFIQRKLEAVDISNKYDFICCFFFLDLFEENGLKKAIDDIGDLMLDSSQLLVSDFQIKSNSLWQSLLSKVMHTFFSLTTNLESKKLKNIQEQLIQQNFEQQMRTDFFGRFIFSAVYKKNVSKNGNHS